jgi:DNA-binding NtrC family response regulator
MLSADVETATHTRAINLKLFEFIRKPAAPEVLIDTVSRALEQSQKIAA